MLVVPTQVGRGLGLPLAPPRRPETRGKPLDQFTKAQGPAAIARVESPTSSTPAVEKAELKLTIPAKLQAKAIAALGLDTIASVEREIRFYDTPKLKLHARGAILRARCEGGKGETTMKVRGAPEDRWNPAWFDRDGFKAENERSIADGKGTVSLSLDVKRACEAVSGATKSKDIRALFNAEQLEMLEALVGEVSLDKLRLYGPLSAQIWKLEDVIPNRKLSVESWPLPNGETILELSLKTKSDEIDQATKELKALLEQHGLRAEKVGRTKTAAMLSAFAG